MRIESDIGTGFDEESDRLESARHRGQLERSQHSIGVRIRFVWIGLLPQSQSHEILFDRGVHVDAEIEEPLDSLWCRITRGAECVKCWVRFFGGSLRTSA